jgi:hypothetical protein
MANGGNILAAINALEHKIKNYKLTFESPEPEDYYMGDDLWVNTYISPSGWFSIKINSEEEGTQLVYQINDLVIFPGGKMATLATRTDGEFKGLYLLIRRPQYELEFQSLGGWLFHRV